MALTPLFPQEPVTIKQGNTGNCYLLAALDCILSSGTEGIARLKSLFSVEDNGQITVRIKKTAISKYLQRGKLDGKFVYHFDRSRQEDVFTITSERLLEIDNSENTGVTTNSLAVKILERLSSYYYVGDWDNQIPLASIQAHNIQDRHTGTSTEFFGHLIGVETKDCEGQDINKIINLKMMFPDYPVYISMDYHQIDNHQKYHGRHALRLDKVTQSSNNYQFDLVNPWINFRRETYDLNNINKRNPRFCLFIINQKMNLLKEQVFNLPLESVKTVLANPKLKKMISELPEDVEINDILECFRLAPIMAKLYELLNGEEKNVFYNGLKLFNSNKGSAIFSGKAFNQKDNDIDFLESFLSNVFKGNIERRLDVVKFVLEQAATLNILVIDTYLKERNKDLFQLITHDNLFKLIYFSGLKKKDFLENLIELEFSRSDISLENLKNISNFINKYNDEHPTEKLDINLSDDIIFSRIKEKPIDEQSPVLEGDTKKAMDTAEEQIQSIVSIYIETIQGLSDSFDELQSAKTIEEHTNSLHIRLDVISNEAKKKLRVSQEAISTINKAVVEKKITIDTSAKRRLTVIQNNWAIIQNYIEQIEDFVFSFLDNNDIDQVSITRENFIKGLKSIIDSKNLEAALRTLGFNNQYPPVLNNAFKRKLEKINLSAENQISELKNARKFLDQVYKNIQGLEVSYKTAKSDKEISEHQIKLNNDLEDLSKETENVLKALNILGLNCFPEKITLEVTKKQRYIQLLATQQKLKKKDTHYQKLNAQVSSNISGEKKNLSDPVLANKQKTEEADKRILHILESSGFIKQLKIIQKKKDELRQNAIKDPNGYQDAANASEKLNNAILDIHNNLINQTIQIQQFKEQINEAIKEALPVLKNHRGWKQVLADIVNAIIMIVSLFTSYLVTNRFRFFELPTDSEEKIVELMNIIKKLDDKSTIPGSKK